MRKPSEEGWTDFVNWYVVAHPRLVSSLRLAHRNGREHVLDAVDEACVRAYERWPRVRQMDSPTGWAYVVARNELTRRRGIAARAQDPRQSSSQPDTTMVEVIDLLSRLSPRQREVVVLRCLLDMNEADTANLLGISRSAVSSTLVTARHRLKTVLQDDGGGPSE